MKKVEQNDLIKKYKTNIAILKFIAIFLSLIILIAGGILASNYIKERNIYKNAEHIYEIMNETYKNIDKIENSNNYTFSQYIFYEGKLAGKNILQYKDKKYKEEHTSDYWKTTDYINYGVVLDEKTKLMAQYNIEDSKWDINGALIGKVRNNSFDGFHKNKVMEYINHKIRDDNYEGKEYYVVSYPSGKDGDLDEYSELWIDKETMLLFRWIYDIEEKNEDQYSWETNNVTDEDVKILDENAEKEFQERVEKFKQRSK